MIWLTTSPHVDLGFLPSLISEGAGPVAKQLETTYAHGGGWNPQSGFKLDLSTMTLKYPGDPPMKILAASKCGSERLFFYPYAYLLIMQEDDTWEIARVD